jgi:hypothetical protein
MWCVCHLRTGRDSWAAVHLPRHRSAPFPPLRCHGSCVAEVSNALARTRPVLRTSDDTHTTSRATTLRAQPLGALAVLHRQSLSPARHVTRPVLGRVRASTTVHTASPVVAVLRLVLARHHRLGSSVAPARAAGLSVARRVCASTRRMQRSRDSG